jgi:hypothetical protein
MRSLIRRRELLRLFAAGLIAACSSARGAGTATRGEFSGADLRREHARGRLNNRPHPCAAGTPPTGLVPLQLSGSDRDGALYVPPSFEPGHPAPLVLSLHGAGGSGRRSCGGSAPSPTSSACSFSRPTRASRPGTSCGAASAPTWSSWIARSTLSSPGMRSTRPGSRRRASPTAPATRFPSVSLTATSFPASLPSLPASCRPRSAGAAPLFRLPRPA